MTVRVQVDMHKGHEQASVVFCFVNLWTGREAYLIVFDVIAVFSTWHIALGDILDFSTF